MKTLLFKPFEKYSERSLLTAGIILTLMGSFGAYWLNARFDGVLDLHFSKNIQFWEPFFDNLINVFLLTALLIFLAKYLNGKTRFIDILTTAMIARTPLYLFLLINSTGAITSMQEEFLPLMNSAETNFQTIDIQKIIEIATENAVSLTIITIASILCLIWYIALLYNGFKTASHAKGTKPIVLFSLAIILAEICSKLLIHNLY